MRESNYWLLHMSAGVIILVFLGIHMLIMHLDEILLLLGIGYEEPLTAASVFERSRDSFFMITYIILLGAALYHGFYGLRNMLFELTMPKSLEVLVNWLFILAGVGLFVYGTYTAIALFIMEGAIV